MKSLRYKQVIVEANTTEHAVEKALTQLNITRDQATSIQVLQKPRKGILGFLKRDAKVLVRCNRSPDERAEQFLRACFDKMGIDPDLTFSPGPVTQSKYIQLQGEQLAILLDRKGRTVEALQYLVNLVANRDHHQPIHYRLDVNGSQKERDQQLIQLASRVSAKVKKERRSIKLVPMPAFERKMIHTLIKHDPALTTESEGIEPNRSVVVRLKNPEHGNS